MLPSLPAPRAAGLARTNGLELYYEDLGPAAAPPVVLIMGLAAQHVFWPDGVVAGLLAQGFRVIRFDNRDIGLSTKLRGARHDPLVRAYVKSALRRPVKAPYRLYDMAADTVGLLDALGLARAHLFGASMGGMIAQLVAARYPERVKSLSVIMTSTLDPKLPVPKPRVLLQLALTGKRSQGGRDAAIGEVVNTYRAIHGRGFAFDAEAVRERAAIAYDRSYHPRGRERQAVNILATGCFEPELARVAAPTLVIHGDDDPLVDVAGGRAVARAIAGSRLEIVRGMGHGMPLAVQPDLAGWVGENVRAGERG
jgi:pimeloyl-ACP methyl ester carboxylesterase